MNERIKELAKQAEEYAVSVCDQRTGVYQGKEYLEVVQDKFAELIVKECIRYFNEDYVRDWSELWREDLSQKINEHFGVE